jgi:hypothetical protein
VKASELVEGLKKRIIDIYHPPPPEEGEGVRLETLPSSHCAAKLNMKETSGTCRNHIFAIV